MIAIKYRIVKNRDPQGHDMVHVVHPTLVTPECEVMDWHGTCPIIVNATRVVCDSLRKALILTHPVHGLAANAANRYMDVSPTQTVAGA